MKQILLFVVGIWSAVSMYPQEVVLHGRLLDSETGLAVSGAHVIVNDGLQADVSDALGKVELLIDADEVGEMVTLTVTHLSYRSEHLTLTMADILARTENGLYPFDLQMRRGVTDLPPIEILDDHPPELVYGNSRHSIADYELMGDQLLLLTYERTLRRRAKLYLSDLDMTLLDSLSLPSRIEPIGIQRDYSDRIFLRTESKVYHIDVDANGLRYSEVDAHDFRDRIEPVIDTVGGRLIFSTWTERFPAFDYLGFQASDSSYHHLRQIADEFMLELCRAEYKYLNTPDKLKLFRMELETGIEREVLACIATFEDGLYYDPIHAPMFVWQDTIYIFDHHNHQLFIHDGDQQPIDSVAIDYHSHGKKWANTFTDRLVMDEGTGEVYAIFQAPGGRCTLALISKENGSVERRIDLDYDYPDGIRVLDGEVYYIYRPYESIQKRYLYKEGLE